MYNIGIVGNGFVGNAIYQNIKEKYNTKVYDLQPDRSNSTLEDIYSCDIVFVCLPTPMLHADGGKCNLSIIETFFHNVPFKTDCLFVIKSTVPIGTTKKISNTRPDLKVVHNPEFLTANNAIEDFKNSNRNIIGHNNSDGMLLLKFLNELFPNAKNMLVSSDESETIKYFANTYLATKVAFFNIMYDVSIKYNINYNNLVDGVCSDTRIGYSHAKVPGPDGDRGFGGTCFPKDINSLIHTLEDNELNSSILKEIWNYNKSIRKDWDWANNKSAVNNKE
jgi:UDPglucose 6-dehydrogenase